MYPLDMRTRRNVIRKEFNVVKTVQATTTPQGDWCTHRPACSTLLLVSLRDISR